MKKPIESVSRSFPIVVLASMLFYSSPAAGLLIDVTDPAQVVSVRVGNYRTDMLRQTYLESSSNGVFPALFATDYPGQTYEFGGAREGVLSISMLDVFQTGSQGGLNIVASFDGAAADYSYRWLQYIDWSPVGAPFRGETSSPFTDPPLLDVDDNLPFYWTNLERAAAGTGWVTGGDQDDNPRFSDGPRANNFRAAIGTPFSFSLNLFLSDYDASTERVIIYDGVRYGFTISQLPGPPPVFTLLLGFALMAGMQRARRA